MSGDSRWEHDSLPLEALERINRVCVQFEAVWKQEQEPRIEDYLGATEGEERAVLLRELLLLDLDYRWRLDKPPVADDYRHLRGAFDRYPSRFDRRGICVSACGGGCCEQNNRVSHLASLSRMFDQEITAAGGQLR